MNSTAQPYKPNSNDTSARNAAVQLIVGQLQPLIREDVDWIESSLKRIRSRVADISHVQRTTKHRIKQIESQLGMHAVSPESTQEFKTLIREYQSLEDKNCELESIAQVCRLAVSMLELQRNFAKVSLTTRQHFSPKNDQSFENYVRPKDSESTDSANDLSGLLPPPWEPI